MGLFDLNSVKKSVDSAIIEKIRRRRLQIMVTSYMYSELDETYISDEEWDRRAKELAELQKEYPQESKVTVYYEKFKDWEGDTAAGLTYDDWVISTAHHLLEYRDRKKG